MNSYIDGVSTLTSTLKNKAAWFYLVNGTITQVPRTPNAEPVLASLSRADCATAASSCDEALVRAFRFLGKRWSGVILGTLTGGPLGFAELGRRVEGISDSVLAERLSDLQVSGLVLRDVQVGPPVSVTYTLSSAGSALLPAMHELSMWAANNLPREV
jgi:DNA-binding HxlR family transcriptional regulator